MLLFKFCDWMKLQKRFAEAKNFFFVSDNAKVKRRKSVFEASFWMEMILQHFYMREFLLMEEARVEGGEKLSWWYDRGSFSRYLTAARKFVPRPFWKPINAAVSMKQAT